MYNVKIADLAEYAKILNLSEIARLSDMNINTLKGMINNGRELSVVESEKVTKVLNDWGIFPEMRKNKETV